MEPKTAHEPEAKVMNAMDVLDDARRLAQVLQRNASEKGHLEHLQVPLSAYLAALDELSRDELVILQQRVEERLALA